MLSLRSYPESGVEPARSGHSRSRLSRSLGLHAERLAGGIMVRSHGKFPGDSKADAVVVQSLPVPEAALPVEAPDIARPDDLPGLLGLSQLPDNGAGATCLS